MPADLMWRVRCVRETPRLPFRDREAVALWRKGDVLEVDADTGRRLVAGIPGGRMDFVRERPSQEELADLPQCLRPGCHRQAYWKLVERFAGRRMATDAELGLCRPHRNEARAASRSANHAKGLCRCGKTRTPGNMTCPTCRERNTKRTARRREKERAKRPGVPTGRRLAERRKALGFRSRAALARHADLCVDTIAKLEAESGTIYKNVGHGVVRREPHRPRPSTVRKLLAVLGD